MPVHKIKHRLAVSLLAGLLLLLPMQYSQKAAAADNKTITLICRQDETILSGMEWTLYRIGVRHDTAVEFVPALSGYSMDLGDLSSKTVDTAAKTIEGYVLASGIAPVSQGQTDDNGELAFRGLDNGLYLAAGKNLQVGNTCYIPSTLLLEVNNADAGLDYDAYPKFSYTDLSGQERKYTVRKVWIDEDNAYQKRPSDLTIDLYKDDALSETVILNEGNNWEYAWVAPEDGAEWKAVEREIPEQYSVMIDYNSWQFLIRNTFEPVPQTTTTSGTETTTVTTSTTAPPVTTVTTTTKLVQTGQLWWPVLPLSLGGVILVGAGIAMRSGKKKHEE